MAPAELQKAPTSFLPYREFSRERSVYKAKKPESERARGLLPSLSRPARPAYPFAPFSRSLSLVLVSLRAGTYKKGTRRSKEPRQSLCPWGGEEGNTFARGARFSPWCLIRPRERGVEREVGREGRERGRRDEKRRGGARK